MLNVIKEFAKRSAFYDYVKTKRQEKALVKWEKSMFGRKGPLPHILKQFTVKDYALKYNCSILIETGTFEGEMVKSALNVFKSIYSIELEPSFYRRAAYKFRRYEHVHILQGNSGEKLSEVMKSIQSRAIFWLDAHYSGGRTAKGTIETPVESEIEAIFNHKVRDHIILIDDARCFDGRNDYPVLDKFITRLKERRADIRVEVYNDITRITPDKPIIK